MFARRTGPDQAYVAGCSPGHTNAAHVAGQRVDGTEPRVRIERTAARLQGECSTTELTGQEPDRTARRRSACVRDLAVLEVHVQLALDALQRVVDRLHVPLQHLGDLLVALSVDVE